MKVIMRQAVPDLGQPGDVVKVKDGYARNYLIPQGFAEPATGKNLGHLSNLKQVASQKRDRLQKEAEQLAEKIAGISVTIAKPVGENERLFGTVTPMEISEALAMMGVEVDRRKIVIEDPIKVLGPYTVTVKLHALVQSSLKVEVVEEAKE